jgi:rhamnulokinase
MAVPVESALCAGAPWCYISCGTWALMGMEVARPVITDRCARLNFTNEAGVGGTTRLLKNIAGLWLLQECRRVWRQHGQEYSWSELVGLAVEAPALECLVNPDDPGFLTPEEMPQAIREACRASGQSIPESPGAVIRCALESLALKFRQVLGWLEEITGSRIAMIHIVGGGAQNELLCQMTADACNIPVAAGPVEATAIGNLMMQAVAAGEVVSIAEARGVIRSSFNIVHYDPHREPAWDDAWERFRSLFPPLST